jgi:hypothetical protein
VSLYHLRHGSAISPFSIPRSEIGCSSDV